jgi:hypothetical protein
MQTGKYQLEILMFRRSINSFLCTALLIALLPFAFLAALCSRLMPKGLKKAGRRGPHREAASAVRAVGEFEFHRALTAYEELIDQFTGDSAA